MVQRRVSNWIEDEFIYNQELTSEPIDLRVAVVGHGTASRCLFQYIMRFDDSMLSRIAIENTSIGRFLFDKQGWAMLKLNDSSHLDDNGVPNFEAAP
jgi:broad specificity phosphatase PhoE